MPYSVPCPLGEVTSVPAERRSARPGGAVGTLLLSAHGGGEPVVGEHVELGRHAEHERTLERVAEHMGVGIDESGQECAAIARNRLDSTQAPCRRR